MINASILSPGRVVLRPSDRKQQRLLQNSMKAVGEPYSILLDPLGVEVSFDYYRDAIHLQETFEIHEAAGLTRLRNSRSFASNKHLEQLCRDVQSDPQAGKDMLEGFDDIDRLDNHQVSAVALASHPEITGLCIFDEQGLGKTVEALFAVRKLMIDGHIGRTIVFAPKNMLLEWKNDLDKFFPEEYVCEVITGAKAEKRASLDRRADMYVTNFETANSLPVRLRQLIEADRTGTLIIVDESFFVKNRDSRRTQSVQKLRDAAKRCLVLCGTPAPNDPSDIIEQFNLADQGTTFGNFKVPDDLEERRAAISERLKTRGCYIRRLKHNVMPHLPGRCFTTIPVELSYPQRRLYDDIRDNLLNDLSSVSDDEFLQARNSYMARRIKLLQVCTSPRDVDPEFSGGSSKSDHIAILLDKLIAQDGEKVILWSFFTSAIDASMKRFANYQPVRIDGKVSSSAVRRDAVQRFQEDENTKLFIANPAAAGAGLTLHAARYAVYESLSNQAAHYFQSLDRIHRRGQTREVEYFFLQCNDTIEEVEYARLRHKEGMARSLLGDDIPVALTRQALIDELTA